MSLTALGLLALFLLLAAALLLLPFYARYRGTRLITCPETHRPAAVDVDALHAAASLLGGTPELRLKDCSRWPEKAGCGQECLSEVELDEGACLLRGIVSAWYQGKSCAFCRKPIPAVTWTEHRPALLRPDGATVSWTDVKPETLPDLFATHRPVCWDCHVVQSLIRERPDAVTVRPEREHLWS
jgi:hypothetical protein